MPNNLSFMATASKEMIKKAYKNYELRQEIDGHPTPPKDEQLEFVSCRPTTKVQIAGQSSEQAEPCPDKIRGHIFLILEVKETFLTRKLLGGQKGSDVKSTHRPPRWNPSWLRDACAHMGGF